MSIKKKIINQKKILFVKKYTVGKKKKKTFSDKIFCMIKNIYGYHL